MGSYHKVWISSFCGSHGREQCQLEQLPCCKLDHVFPNHFLVMLVTLFMLTKILVFFKPWLSLFWYMQYIPLRLVGQFKEEVVKILAPDKRIYIVGAKKHNDDQIVLQSGWDSFVACQCIQQNDFLIFIIEGETRLKVLVLDPSGSEKTSCFAMGNSSNAREVREDSVEIVDKEPPPPTVNDLSSDDDEVIGEGMRKSCRRQKGVPGRCAKTRIYSITLAFFYFTISHFCAHHKKVWYAFQDMQLTRHMTEHL